MSCNLPNDHLENLDEAVYIGTLDSWQKVREFFSCDRRCLGAGKYETGRFNGEDDSCHHIMDCLHQNIYHRNWEFSEEEKAKGYTHDADHQLPTPSEQRSFRERHKKYEEAGYYLYAGDVMSMEELKEE